MEQKQRYTIIAFTENTPGVLYRVSNLFLRRKINIESLTVSETEKSGLSRFTIVVESTKNNIDKIIKQLYRIIEVFKVFESEDRELLYKEIAFIKVSTKNASMRREVEDTAYIFQAKVLYAGSDFLVIEKTGTEEEIESMLLLLRPFGIKELVRSGRIAVLRDAKKFEGKFNMEQFAPASAIANLEVSSIKRMQLLADADKKVISLAQGIPSFATPMHIKQAAKKAIDENLVGKYTSGYGIEALREAIVTKVRRDNNIKADTQQVIVTHGGIEALMSIFMALLNPSDEIIIPTPDYASHITQTRIVRHGGLPVFVPLNETPNGWVLDAERLEGAITQQTKAILICNPCNPTGKVYSKAELAEVARIANKYNLFIITDEMYEYFTFDGKKHISIGSMPEAADRVISVFGLSKSYAMTGWRIGYIVADKRLIPHIFKVHDSLITCPAAVSQYAALAALQGPQNVVKEFRNAFDKRRQIVFEALSKTDKLKLVKPEGAYYALAKVAGNVDDYDLSMRLLHEAKVAVVPGSAFGPGGESHIRLSFGCEEPQLREGLRRLVGYLEKKV
ncbi:acetolactate synthase small subunit [Patescibacteria group bacterium]|nr:acetolactate synthase small subunit [Patescibacteria group bacterium]MBU4016957.1 acetolactate synthase small subunit [Patescibacteria group bacterium]